MLTIYLVERRPDLVRCNLVFPVDSWELGPLVGSLVIADMWEPVEPLALDPLVDMWELVPLVGSLVIAGMWEQMEPLELGPLVGMWQLEACPDCRWDIVHLLADNLEPVDFDVGMRELGGLPAGNWEPEELAVGRFLLGELQTPVVLPAGSWELVALPVGRMEPVVD